MVEDTKQHYKLPETKITFDGNSSIYTMGPSLKWQSNHLIPSLDPPNITDTASIRNQNGDLINYFSNNPGMCLTPTQLIQELWGENSPSTVSYYEPALWTLISRVRKTAPDFGFNVYSSFRNETFDAIYVAIPSYLINEQNVIRIPFPGLTQTKANCINKLGTDIEPLLSWYISDSSYIRMESPLTPRQTSILLKLLSNHDLECNINQLKNSVYRREVSSEQNLWIEIHRLKKTLASFDCPLSIYTDKERHFYYLA